jgi:hypothetical protein
MTLLFKNNASTTLSGSINNTQTTMTVVNGSGFPVPGAGDYFYATLYEVTGNPSTEVNIEIVKVTAVSGNSWTIVRGQDGTTARARDGVTTCYVENRFTAASAANSLQHENNLSDLQSASTARTNLGLGSIATQAASNVNITGGTISGVTISTIDSTTTIADNADTTKKVAFEVSGVATSTTRTLTVPNANGTIALTSDLSSYQPLDSDLTAVAALSANGLVARTGTGTAAVRAITQPAAGITVTNGDGVSGNPTLGLANDLGAVEAISGTGFVRRTAADTWSASALVDADIPGALTGKTYNGVTLASAATGFSVAGGTTSKTLTVNKSLTLDGTDGTTITFPSTTGTLALNNQTLFLGTTSVAINRSSGSLALSGVSIDGSASSATSAVSATTATNLASGVLGSVPYQSAAGTTALVGPNTTTTRNFLRMTGTGTAGAAPAWDSVTKTDVGLANVEDTALSTWAGSTNITTLGTVASGTWNANTIGISKGGTGQTTATAAFDALAPTTTLGDLVYHDGTDNVRLAGNTTVNRRFLRQTGTGSVSAAPAWDGLADGDIPSALTGKTYNGLSITSSTGTLTVSAAKTLTVSNTLTLAGTDSSTLNIGSGGTLGSAAFTASSSYVPAAGSSSITTLGTITTGVWTGSAIGISSGGTGQTTKAAGFNALSPITTLGDLVYGDGANSNARLAGNTSTTKRFLTQTGDGTVSAAPGWNAVLDGDLPSALTGKTYNALTLTANATGFSVGGGTTSKTLSISNNLTFSGTDGSTLNVGGGGTLGTAAYTASTAYQPADADLTAIAALSGTSGFLKKTAADTWSLDTTSYLTGNQSISLSGDATGSGATSISVVLANSGVTAGTYPKVTVDAKGRVTAGASLASADVTGALGFTPQTQDADLTAIAGLTGTSGLLRKTAADTWSLDTNSYLTANQNITVSGDATGSGATSISLTLANSGVTAGTYTKLTVDAKGRVTSGATLASGDLPTYTGSLTSTQVTTALGYTPYNSTNPNGYITSSGSITGSAGSVAWTNVTGRPTNVSSFTNDSGYITSSGSITGSAGSVAWTNVTGRPTAVSSFTNDSGYITSSGSISGNAATATTATTANALNTSNSYQAGSLGVGTAASGTTGEIRATSNITAYYSSDRRLKENIRDIPNAVDAIDSIGGKLFDWTDSYIESRGGEDGYFVRKSDFGVVAQDVQSAFPLAVREREDGTLAVDYEKLCALAFAAIKELSARVKALEAR